MKKEENKFTEGFNLILIFLPSIIVLALLLLFLGFTGSDSRDTNEKLKKENYELKTKIRQLEDEKLKCLLSK